MKGAAVSNRHLSDAIERDLLRERTAMPEAQICLVCARSYGKGDGRFCSVRCRDAFDDGYPPYDRPAGLPKIGDTPRVVVAGPPTLIARDLPTRSGGWIIPCAGCKRDFVSKGLRCCSPECEKKCREHLEIEATMREVGAEAAPKRRCEVCNAVIPRWTKGGRAVKKTVRFCSDKCRQKAKQHSRSSTPSTTAKSPLKALQNGPFPEPVQSPPVAAEASVVAAPIDIIGGGSFRFEGSGLDRAIVRAIFSTELPATVTPNSGERAKDAGTHRADRTIENGAANPAFPDDGESPGSAR
jgi:hypothetical protein